MAKTNLLIIWTLLLFSRVNLMAQDTLVISIQGINNDSIPIQVEQKKHGKIEHIIQKNQIQLILIPGLQDKNISWIISWQLEGESIRDLGIKERSGRLESFDTLNFSFKPNQESLRTRIDSSQILKVLKDSVSIFKSKIEVLNDSIKTLKNQPPETVLVKEYRHAEEMAKAIIIPGGARFYNQSWVLGSLLLTTEVSSLGLAIWCNQQKQYYYGKANEAARMGNAEDLNQYFNKSEDFRTYRNWAIGIGIAVFGINLFDAIFNVKKREKQPISILKPKNRVVSFIPEIEKETVMFHLVKSF